MAGRAPSVGITGILLTCDDFGRARIAVYADRPRRPRGVEADPTWGALRRLGAVGDGAPDAYGLRGVVSLVLAKRRRAFWLGEVARLRDRWVRIAAAPRGFAFPDGRRGVALDLESLEEFGPLEGPGAPGEPAP